MAYPRLVTTQGAAVYANFEAAITWLLHLQMVRRFLHRFRQFKKKASMKHLQDKSQPISAADFFPNHPALFWLVYLGIIVTMVVFGPIRSFPVALAFAIFGVFYFAELSQWEPEIEDKNELIGMAVLEEMNYQQEPTNNTPW